jgi:hypothetical protein
MYIGVLTNTHINFEYVALLFTPQHSRSYIKDSYLLATTSNKAHCQFSILLASLMLNANLVLFEYRDIILSLLHLFIYYTQHRINWSINDMVRILWKC